MTIKFSIRHHYKDVPIEFTVEAEDTKDLDNQMLNALRWIKHSRFIIDQFYEETKKLTEKEKEKP